MGSFSEAPAHFLLFPSLAQGHIIPLLNLGRLLRRRSAVITVCTTPGNAVDFKNSLIDTDIRVIELPFPQNIDGVPAGVENTHKLTSMDAFVNFVSATKFMQKSFEDAIETLSPPVTAVISDFFLGWTVDSAAKFHIPRYVFSGMCQFTHDMYVILERDVVPKIRDSLDDPFPMPDFPAIVLTMNDFDPSSAYLPGAFMDFILEQKKALDVSQGILVNSFYELEGVYIDYWNQKFRPRAFCIGPVSEALRELKSTAHRYTEFLDEKLANEQPVLYVAFGTQAHVPPEQIEEIAVGLEKSGVSFLWALRSNDEKFIENFNERVKGRGILTNDWVDQIPILRHGGVKGFLSHCGWNSVMESIAAGVPILGLPFIAEQHMNARFVAEVAGVGLRAMPVGSVRGLVTAEEIEKKVRELMIGEEGAEVRRTAAEMGRAAQKAVGEGGSSYLSLDHFVDEINGSKRVVA